VSDLGRRQEEDHGHHHTAHGGDPSVRGEHLRAVGEHHGHPIARPDPEGVESPGELSSLGQLLDVRAPPVPEEQGVVLAEALDVLLGQPSQIHRPRV
jgi:hypothetical protein